MLLQFVNNNKKTDVYTPMEKIYGAPYTLINVTQENEFYFNLLGAPYSFP